jgi:hypothetical protein
VQAADTQLLAEGSQQAGNAGTFTLLPAGTHVYVRAFWTAEARAALCAVNQLLSRLRPRGSNPVAFCV